ncbi:MAG TPA: hypothetical protein VMV49_05175 [Candidatus Deferrimicrobium sp.]|nr:hypothetical protein [Candidatus Deferrimicrobium sp.]
MAARAIIGILLGILFLPVFYLLLYASGSNFSSWFWTLFGSGDFMGFMEGWMQAGALSTIAPLVGTYGLIPALGAGSSLLGMYLPMFGTTFAVWAMIGAWSGAIERSAGRGIGVAVGIWLGWFIITMILYFVDPIMPVALLVMYMIPNIMQLILAQILPLIMAILVAAIFGAMTKSEEF